MIAAIVLVCYGLVPVAGAFRLRRFWRAFRRRFGRLALCPALDYRQYRSPSAREYRLCGGFESLVAESGTLWIKSENLSVPVLLEGAQTYLLPIQNAAAPGDDSFEPGEEAPEKFRWDRISTLTEGARVFVGGPLRRVDDRWTFASEEGAPLLVIFYDGPDRLLAPRAIRAGRRLNEYWNPVTPYALAAGAFSLLTVALSFLSRPIFRLTAFTAFAAVFVPLFPIIPPGILFTLPYRFMWRRGRLYRAWRDLILLPSQRLGGGGARTPLTASDGSVEWYGCVRRDSLPAGFPAIIPWKGKANRWYLFGAFSAAVDEDALPREPADPMAVYGAIPGGLTASTPRDLASSLTRKAYLLESAAWVLLLLGIAANAVFIGLVVSLI